MTHKVYSRRKVMITSTSTQLRNHQEQGQQFSKMKLTVYSAKGLHKRDWLSLPDPFVKVVVEDTWQCHSTSTVKNSLDPSWNETFNLYLASDDCVVLSVWNARKSNKEAHAGFLGSVRLTRNDIQRLKDSGSQLMKLTKGSTSEDITVKGNISISLTADQKQSSITRILTDSSPNQLPEGWKLQRTGQGRVCYVNCYTKTTQWDRPTRPAYEMVQGRQQSSAVTTHNSSTTETHVQVSQASGPTCYPRSGTDPSRRPSPQQPNPASQNDSTYEQRVTSQGQVYYVNRLTGVSTWHNPSVTTQQASPSDLGPLPEGWEMKPGPNGRVYYINHLYRITQFDDPRLVSTTTSVSPNPKEEDPANQPSSVKRDLNYKTKMLKIQLSSLHSHPGHCKIEVSRGLVLEESYRQTLRLRPKDLRKKLMVRFRGEEGVDYGGIAREWLELLSREMLNPQYGLFQYSRDDIYTLQINPDSGVNPEHLSYFHFIGRIIGLAVFHGHHIDGGFSLPVYKQLLGLPISLEDISSVDPELYSSLKWIMENDITQVLHNTFVVEHDSFGKLIPHELKPGGKDIPLTEANKDEYVRLYVQWRFQRGTSTQLGALKKGFQEIIPPEFLKPFDEKELELLVSGIGKIDVNDWKQNTRLKNCSEDTSVVQWFWQAVESFDDERRARLLQFVTGSSRVPIHGFKALQGSTGAAGPRLFTIHVLDSSTERLPKAHTCFNRLDVPRYETFKKLEEKLICAIEETVGFHVE